MPEAARFEDYHECPAYSGPRWHVGGPIEEPCADTVLINNLKAARVGDLAQCNGVLTIADPIVKGSATVFICGPAAARKGDPMGHGGKILQGSEDVFIGDGGSNSAAMDNAKKKAKSLCDICQMSR